MEGGCSCPNYLDIIPRTKIKRSKKSKKKTVSIVIDKGHSGLDVSLEKKSN